MPRFGDRIKDTTTTTGTGAITLAGTPPTGYVSFATGLGSDAKNVVGYVIDDGAGNWEVGRGSFNGTTTLTRDLVRSSSNSNALVSFAAGTKTVFCSPSSEHIDNSNIGMLYIQSRCIGLQ